MARGMQQLLGVEVLMGQHAIARNQSFSNGSGENRFEAVADFETARLGLRQLASADRDDYFVFDFQEQVLFGLVSLKEKLHATHKYPRSDFEEAARLLFA